MRSSRRYIAWIVAGVLLWGSELRAEDILMERVVAIVENEPVFLTEYIDYSNRLQQGGEWINWQETLARLIDRKLMIIEARRLRLDTELQDPTPDALIQRYVDLVGRARVSQPGARTAVRTMIQDIRADDETKGEVTVTEDSERPRVSTHGSMEQVQELARQLRQRYDIRVLMDGNPSEGPAGR